MAENLGSVLFFCAIPFYVIGFIGNVLVIWIVHKTLSMHTTTNYLLVNLAAADVLTILLAPLLMSSVVGYLTNSLGAVACKIIAVIDISIMVSSLTLTVLAIERYHALLNPFRTRLRLTEDNIKQAIALIWITSVLLSLPSFFFHEWREFDSACVGPWTLHMNKSSKVYFIFYTIFTTYFPLVIMIYCYGSLIKGLYFTHVICAESGNEENTSEKTRLVITFILATAGFFICYAPSVIFFTVLVPDADDEQRDVKLYSDLLSLFEFLFVCSQCFNPVIYAFRSTNFQNGFKRHVFCYRSNQNNNV